MGANRRPENESRAGAAEPSGFGAWLKRHWLLGAATTAIISASVGLVVSRFGPGVLEDLSGKPPLSVSILHEDPGDGSILSFREVIEQEALPAPTSCSDLKEWFESRGAVDAGHSAFKITLEGLRRSPISIESMHASITSRGEPVDGTVLACASEGELPAIEIGFDLDESRPIARTIDEDRSLGEPYFESASIRVTEGESVPLSVTAYAEQCDCQWVIELTVLIEGERHTLMVDDEGEPFRTTAIVNVPSRRIHLYAGEWGYCSGRFNCFPDGDGVPGGPPPQPIPREELRRLKEEHTSQVIPPFER